MSSVWTIKYERHALKQLKKLDRSIADRITKDLQKDLDRVGDARAFGEAMVGNWTGFWRYRINDYRAIAKIEDAVVTIFIVEVAHRREVYR